MSSYCLHIDVVQWGWSAEEHEESCTVHARCGRERRYIRLVLV